MCEFNNGTIHPSVADVMGDLFLIGLEKRDDDGNVVGTRPIGIPAALRRLSGRVLMEAYSEKMGEFWDFISANCVAPRGVEPRIAMPMF